jgi:hypothetical protein
MKLREGLRVIYRPSLWDSFTCSLPKGITGTVTKAGSWFGLYKDPGRKFVNVIWDNGMTEGVSKDSLEII